MHHSSQSHVTLASNNKIKIQQNSFLETPNKRQNDYEKLHCDSI